MSTKCKENASADLPDSPMSYSEEAGPIHSMASPTDPVTKRLRLDLSVGGDTSGDTGGEELASSSVSIAPASDLHAQRLFLGGMPSSPSHHLSNTSFQPASSQFSKRKEEEEDPPKDMGDFPICISILGILGNLCVFMLANSSWTLQRFQQEIVRALRSHGDVANCDLLEYYGCRSLTVMWESERRKAFMNIKFLSRNPIGSHNIHAVLEFLKRKRSDVVVVQRAPIPEALTPEAFSESGE
ncbi:MAG: hypothetical protein Q9184_001420 [Pyrenodesmia sp. 2 TL-2023]